MISFDVLKAQGYVRYENLPLLTGMNARSKSSLSATFTTSTVRT